MKYVRIFNSINKPSIPAESYIQLSKNKNKNKIIYIPVSFYNTCKNLLNLYIHSLFFCFELNEHIRKKLGNILINNG